MTQEKINDQFTRIISDDVKCLYSTIDDKLFFNYNSALSHVIENKLESNHIDIWFDKNDYK